MKLEVPEVGIISPAGFSESEIFNMDLLLLGPSQSSTGECEGGPEVVRGGF